MKKRKDVHTLMVGCSHRTEYHTNRSRKTTTETTRPRSVYSVVQCAVNTKYPGFMYEFTGMESSRHREHGAAFGSGVMLGEDWY